MREEEFPSFRDHPHLLEKLEHFHGQLRDWEAPEVVAASKTKKRAPLTLEGVPILPSRTLDELKRCMPRCIQALADKAFLSGTPHLKYEDRCTLYGFVLANGVPTRVLEENAVGKVSTIPGYDVRQVQMQVRQTEQYVRSSKFGTGKGCNSLQDSGKCPHFQAPSVSSRDTPEQIAAAKAAARKRARVGCHAHQLLLAHKEKDPRGYDWKQVSPLLFAQQVKRWLSTLSTATKQ